MHPRVKLYTELDFTNISVLFQNVYLLTVKPGWSHLFRPIRIPCMELFDVILVVLQ